MGFAQDETDRKMMPEKKTKELVVQVSHLRKSYRSLPVLDDITFELEKGEIVCLLGPSGSGKTTLLNIMAGLLIPDAGECRITGKVSYVFQEARLLPWKTVLENVLFVSEEGDLGSAKQILKKLGLSDFEQYYPVQLSGGMKQRVAIARAYYAGADLLLMDEPFQSLDMELRLRLLKDLIGLWEVKRNSILFVTHHLEEAILLGHRIFVLSDAPTQIKREFKVDIAPADRVPEDFKELKQEIESLFNLVNTRRKQ